MKYLFFTSILCGHFSFSFGQFKTVKLIIDDQKIYFRYFYKSRDFSEEILNDSVRIVGRKISNSEFYLDKFVNKEKIWTRTYRIELAKDSLHITTRSTEKNAKRKFQYSKEPYYNNYLLEN